MDQDLLVDLGNILMLQSVSSPTQTTPGIFDLPNDSAIGGLTIFNFLPEQGVRAVSIDIIDIDNTVESVILTLTDLEGDALIINLPRGYTGNGGVRTVEFQEESTVDLDHIVRLELERNGSGAADNLTFVVEEGQDECNADAMCDDDILCTSDLCVDGQCLHEDIPGCEECTDVSLLLQVSSGLIGPGDVLTVDVVMTCSPLPVVGAQFFLTYDPFDLTFISAEPGDPPFEIEIFEAVNGASGLIDYAVHIPFDETPGATGRIVLATLTFVATNDCGETEINWRENNPPTRLSAAGGVEIVPSLYDAEIRVACPAPESGEAGGGKLSRVKSRPLRRAYDPYPATRPKRAP
jgi:hypothetical protein